mgnify:CR=1 FL=1
MNAQRLRQIRLARGLSLEGLVARMDGLVTRQAISKYENERAQPTPTVLRALAAALEVKGAELLRPPDIAVEFIAYRKGSGLGKKREAALENRVARLLEERIVLAEQLGGPSSLDLPIRSRPAGTLEDAEQVAEWLRSEWQLGIAPIANVVDALEDRSIHVIEIEADDQFDGISAVSLDARKRMRGAAVVSRRGLVGERQRMNLAHELGHLILDPADDLDEEKAAFRFAAAFLVPAEALRREVGLRRNFVQGEELVLLKLKYGISVQALLYRLNVLGIIGPAHYRQWCIAINKKGYRKAEPHPIDPEVPRWLRRSLTHAVAEGFVPRAQAEKMMRENGDSFTIDDPAGGIRERRELLKISAAKRGEILAAQLEAA